MSITITQSGLEVLGRRQDNACLNGISLEVLDRTSGATINTCCLGVLVRPLEPSARIACMYFGIERVSLRELFDKTASNSLMELVNNEQ